MIFISNKFVFRLPPSSPFQLSFQLSFEHFHNGIIPIYYLLFHDFQGVCNQYQVLTLLYQTHVKVTMRFAVIC